MFTIDYLIILKINSICNKYRLPQNYLYYILNILNSKIMNYSKYFEFSYSVIYSTIICYTIDCPQRYNFGQNNNSLVYHQILIKVIFLIINILHGYTDVLGNGKFNYLKIHMLFISMTRIIVFDRVGLVGPSHPTHV